MNLLRRLLRVRLGGTTFGDLVELSASALVVGVMIGLPVGLLVLVAGLALELLW